MHLSTWLIPIAVTYFIHHCNSAKQYSNSFAVHLNGGPAEAHRIAKRHGYINRGQVGPLEDVFWFEHPRISRRSTDAASSHKRLRRETAVFDVVQQEIKVRSRRAVIPPPPDGVSPHDGWGRKKRSYDPHFNDPLFNKLWYLHKGGRGGYDMGVYPAWEQNVTGRGVSVSILDDGIEHSHPDLHRNYDPLASTDINGHDSDPMPRYDNRGTNRHGTRCAGEVAAVANNNVCIVGVAYDAKIGGVRMLDGDVTDLVESQALGLNPHHVDVYSASWGPDDNGRVVDGPGPLAKRVFEKGILQGRGGKGNIFVWASGNGGNGHDSCSCDGYTISIYTISVSSCTESGSKPWYLEECSSTMATTYSSGNSYNDKMIVTVDLKGKCTESHTGTSASAPLAAGLIALALEANPDLTWRDMQHLTVQSAESSPITDENNWVVNGVNRKVSHRYGYGVMHAGRMVELARTWRTVDEQHKCEATPITGPMRIEGAPLTLTVNFDACRGTNKEVRRAEHVQTMVTLSHQNRGCLEIKLKSPAGTWSTILPRRSNDRDTREGFKNWPFMSVFYWDEDPHGVWTIEISCSGGQTGSLAKLGLVVYGTSGDGDGTDPRTPCHEQCENGCHGPFANQCVNCKGLKMPNGVCVATCPENTVSGGHDNATCVSAATQLSSTGCPAGQYPEPSSGSGKCLACDASCRTCYGAAAACTSCRQGERLEGTLCKKSDCVEGQYKPPWSGTCTACVAGCSTCSDDKSCDSCVWGRSLHDGKCLSSCPPGFFSSNHVCSKCMPGCDECEGAGGCMRCSPGYLKSTRGCQTIPKHCPPGQGYSQGGRSQVAACVDCHKSCAVCSGPRTWDCEACPPSSVLDLSECVPKCSEGFYVTNVTLPTGVTTTTCQPCDVNCRTCSGTSQTCVTCTEGWELVHDQCVAKTLPGAACPVGMFRDSSPAQPCRPCPSLCASCNTVTLQCQKCLPGSLLHKGACVRRCPAKYAADWSAQTCVACDKGCAFCEAEAGGTVACLRCEQQWSPHDANSKICVPDKGCPASQFYSLAQASCQPCSKVCKECEASASRCTTCHVDQGLLKDRAVCMRCCKPDEKAKDCCPCNKEGNCVITTHKPYHPPPGEGDRLEPAPWYRKPPLVLALGASAVLVFILVVGGVTFLVVRCCRGDSARYTQLGNEKETLLSSSDDEDDIYEKKPYHDDVPGDGLSD